MERAARRTSGISLGLVLERLEKIFRHFRLFGLPSPEDLSTVCWGENSTVNVILSNDLPSAGVVSYELSVLLCNHCVPRHL